MARSWTATVSYITNKPFGPIALTIRGGTAHAAASAALKAVENMRKETGDRKRATQWCVKIQPLRKQMVIDEIGAHVAAENPR